MEPTPMEMAVYAALPARLDAPTPVEEARRFIAQLRRRGYDIKELNESRPQQPPFIQELGRRLTDEELKSQGIDDLGGGRGDGWEYR